MTYYKLIKYILNHKTTKNEKLGIFVQTNNDSFNYLSWFLSWILNWQQFLGKKNPIASPNLHAAAYYLQNYSCWFLPTMTFTLLKKQKALHVYSYTVCTPVPYDKSDIFLKKLTAFLLYLPPSWERYL